MNRADPAVTSTATGQKGTQGRKQKPLREDIKRFIEEITPYYTLEKISEFRERLKFIPKGSAAEPEITEYARALRGNAKTYEISIINRFDPSRQVNNTGEAIFNLLRGLLDKKRGFKFSLTLQVLLWKKVEEEGKNISRTLF